MTPRPARSTAPSVLAGLPLLAALLLSGCSTGGPDDPAQAVASSPTSATSATSAPSTGPTRAAAPSTAPAPAATITMLGFEYQLPPSVPAGSEVTVVNQDDEAHTFTLSGMPEVRLVVPPRGGSAVFVAPAVAGTYGVVCEFHGGMTASLVVA